MKPEDYEKQKAEEYFKSKFKPQKGSESTETTCYTKKDIPEGGYCYTMLSWDGRKMEVKHCPFWNIREDKPEQQNGYCSFLKKGDWEGEGLSLLWDQVKECGENYGDNPYGVEGV